MKVRILTLRRAIVLVVVLSLLFPALLISGYFWFKHYNDDTRKQTEELLLQNAAILSNGIQEPLWNLNQESGNALLEAMMSRNEDIVHIEVRDNALGEFVSNERPERRTGFTAVTEKPVIYRGNMIGLVKIEVGSTRLRHIMIKGLMESIAAVTAQVILSIVLILLLLEHRLVRPLERLGTGAKRLAERELDTPFTWQRLDEIGLLSRRMEDTRISLHKLFEELDLKNQELEQDIDKRKRVELELHEREKRFRALVEQSPIAIIEWNNQYQVIEWNAAAERIFGYTREQAIGQHASFIIPGSSRETVHAELRRLTTGKPDSRNLGQNRRIDGKIITCQWSHRHIADESGKSDRLLSTAEDVTEKRRAEEALGLSEEKFARAFECNPDSIAIIRMSDGVIMDVNQTFLEITGYTREETIGKPSSSLKVWIDQEQRRGLFRELQTSRVVRNYAWDMRSKYGVIRQCLTNGTVFSASNEHYLLAVIRDVTDQRMLEEQKAEVDRALLRLAQGTRNMAGESFFDLLVADLASALRMDCAFIGLRIPDAQNRIRTLAAHIHGSAMENFEYASTRTPCERILEGEISVLPAEIQTKFSFGAPLAEYDWESYAGAPLRDIAGNTIGVLAVIHSETLGNPDLVKSLLQVFSERASAELERKQAEEALEQRVVERTEELQRTNKELAHAIETLNKAQEELVRSEKLAALGSLVAGIAHELNTPIGNSLMVASTLLDQTRALTSSYVNDKSIKRSSLESFLKDGSTAGDILVRNLERAANLVTSFKQVAVDQTSSQRRQFSVAEVVSEIMLTLWPTFKKTSFTVEQSIPDDLVMDSYPGPFGQVITNLVNNALLHGFEGRKSGTVSISARKSADDWLEFVVEDDGVGIPPSNLNRIFDPFFTTRFGAGGSGLGLNITHNIVSGILGGRIRVQSEVERGCAFILALPFVAPHYQPEEV